MKKIIAINLSTSKKKLGGAAIAAKYHSMYIAQNYKNYELWRMWDKDYFCNEDGLKIRNFKSYTVNKFFRKLLPRKLIALFTYSKIISELKKVKPNIIHIHNVLPPFEFFRISRFCKKENIFLVVSTHGFYEIFNPNFNFNFLEKFFWKILVTFPVQLSLKFIDKIISSYPEEIDFLNSLNVYPSRIKLIPNGVNPFYETESSEIDKKNVIKKFSINNKLPILIFTGNHTKNKGLDIVIKLANNLKRKIIIIIGGKLNSQNEPELYLKDFKSDFVEIIFTDYLTDIEQKALFQISTLLLFPSRSDTSPLTIIEAMASSLPVIAFNVGGIKYQLENNSGFLVNKLSFNDFLNMTNKILDNQNLISDVKKNALKRQKNIFNWEKAAFETLKIYNELLNINKFI